MEYNNSNEMSESILSNIFSISEYEKLDALNLIQYTILAIIPITILNKVVKKLIPEVDESKGSLELFFEVVAQLIIIMLGIFFTNKIIINIPTYSGSTYPEMELFSNVLNIIMFALTIKTKLSDKINIIYNRAVHQLNGTEGFENDNDKEEEKEKSNKKSKCNNSTCKHNRDSDAMDAPMPTNISATANATTSNEYMATLNEDLEDWNRNYNY